MTLTRRRKSRSGNGDSLETTPEPAPGVQEALDEKDQLEEEVRKLKKNIRKVNIDLLVEVYLFDLIGVVVALVS